MAVESFWQAFGTDPRLPANAGVRASDADREVVRTLLAQAYADGRLTREEHDQRLARVLGPLTLGDVVGLVEDLLPATSLALRPPAGAADAHLVERAQAAYRRDLREDTVGFVGSAVVCLAIWAIVMFGGFFWPGIVMAVSGANVLRTLMQREQIVTKELERLRRKEAKALERPERRPEAQ